MAQNNILDTHPMPSSQVDMIDDIGQALTSTFDMNEVISLIMKNMTKLFELENWSLLLVDDASGELYFEVAIDHENKNINGLRFKSEEGVAGWVLKEKKTLIIDDVSRDDRFTGHIDKLTSFKTKSIIAVPLIFRNKTIGVLELVNCKEPKKIKGAKLKLLTLLADFAAIAISNSKHYQYINQLTITDDLTGLNNSRHLHYILDEEISRCLKEKKPLTLIFIDIDHLKKINDAHGHLAGSEVISEFGQVIKSILRSGDFGARYGGDEFVVILPETSKAETMEIASLLRQNINKKHFLGSMGIDLHLTASFGVATFPDDADSKDAIIKIADDMMYKVKNSTRNAIASA
ncbi:MAG: sensor domain-containing diguanylate cyclase [Desulfobacterales bacterium]|nr:sensor domain-containing diguanylate cyclase [Desulfobacterales bacterium]